MIVAFLSSQTTITAVPLWPPASSGHFPGANRSFAGCFLFSTSSSMNPRVACLWMSQCVRSFWSTQTCRTGTKNQQRLPSRGHSNHISSPSPVMLALNFSRKSWPWLNALSGRHYVVSSDVCASAQLSQSSPVQVIGKCVHADAANNNVPSEHDSDVITGGAPLDKSNVVIAFRCVR